VQERRLKEGEFITSKTDVAGKITYGNKTFIAISGYSEKELLGAPHSILRHPDMPKAIFKLLWERIKSKEEIFAFVKNRCKDGSHYWVFANVTASVSQNGNIIGFYSVRRKPKDSAIKEIEVLYKELLDAEKSGGVEGSVALLNKKLAEKGKNYDEYIINLQK